MAKLKPNPALSRAVVTGKEKRAMTRMTLQRNTCPGCATTYRNYAASVACEEWHRKNK